MGYVAKNRGFINPVNAIGVGAHKHFVCLSGGQMVVSGSSSQFGDFSFWSEGSTQKIQPLKVPQTVLVTQANAAAVINAARTTLINDMWQFLVYSQCACDWPENYETDGTCVYSYAFHAGFTASWDRLTAQLIAGGQLTTAAAAMVLALVARLKATMNNHWFEVGVGPPPSPVEPVRRKLRSMITAINHQWTAPMAGVEFYRVPPARAARRIQRSIRQLNGGRVRFSGQDDAGNAVFVGGLTIDARSGQLGGPPFDSALRGRLTRGVISRSY
jgi:hypothetical protein